MCAHTCTSILKSSWRQSSREHWLKSMFPAIPFQPSLSFSPNDKTLSTYLVSFICTLQDKTVGTELQLFYGSGQCLYIWHQRIRKRPKSLSLFTSIQPRLCSAFFFLFVGALYRDLVPAPFVHGASQEGCIIFLCPVLLFWASKENSFCHKWQFSWRPWKGNTCHFHWG